MIAAACVAALFIRRNYHEQRRGIVRDRELWRSKPTDVDHALAAAISMHAAGVKRVWIEEPGRRAWRPEQLQPWPTNR